MTNKELLEEQGYSIVNAHVAIGTDQYYCWTDVSR